MKIQLKNKMLTAGRVFCIGRNYVAHARELNNEVPATPVVFMKPVSCLAVPGEPIPYPPHGKELHHEAELVVLVGDYDKLETAADARRAVLAISLGLDLTLRDVQSGLKQKGLPWEKAKSFEKSAPVGQFVPVDEKLDLHHLTFECRVNGELRQLGDTALMIFPVETLLLELSKIWRLQPGDLIFTGTPAGVGPLKSGDRISVSNDLTGTFEWQIVDATELDQ